MREQIYVLRPAVDYAAQFTRAWYVLTRPSLVRFARPPGVEAESPWDRMSAIICSRNSDMETLSFDKAGKPETLSRRLKEIPSLLIGPNDQSA